MLTLYTFSATSPLKNCFTAGRFSMVWLVNTEEKNVLMNVLIQQSSAV